MITAMYYRVCMAPDIDRTEKAVDLVPANLRKTSPFPCKTNEHRNVILSRSRNFDWTRHSIDSIYTKSSVGSWWGAGMLDSCENLLQLYWEKFCVTNLRVTTELWVQCRVVLFEIVRGSNDTGFVEFSYQLITTIPLFLVDQAAHYHTLPANHHSTIVLYSSVALTRQHIITFSLLITIPPLFYTHL